MYKENHFLYEVNQKKSFMMRQTSANNSFNHPAPAHYLSNASDEDRSEGEAIK